MIAEAIQSIRNIVTQANAVQQFNIGDRVYTDKTITEVPNSLPAIPGVMSLTTLEGLVDVISSGLEGFKPENALVHVFSPTEVRLMEKVSDKWGRCKVYAKSSPVEVRGIQFGQYIDHESFLIAVQSGFTVAGDRDYVLKVAANVTAEAVTTSEDDGVTQRIGVKQGVALKTTETLKARVSLAPFRTFREIEQPASEFIFRVKQEGQGIPKMALFEADGGKWRIDAMESISVYLKSAINDIPIIA